MKISLVHAYFLNDDERERKVMKPYPPLGILYIGAFLEENGYDVTVHDGTFSSFDLICESLVERCPDVIGIYTNLMTRSNVIRLISFIRNDSSLSSSKIVLGGPEPRHHFEKLIQKGADYIVFGEGEETFLELVRSIENNKPASLIKGLAGVGFRNEERALAKSIDMFPEPARHLVDMRRYFSTWQEHHGKAVVSVSTMRGCPYSCNWCSRAVYGKSYRRRSPVLVVNELKRIIDRYGVSDFWFVDDVFTVSHKWLKEFNDALLSSGIQITYECITRADRMNGEVINLLRASGCRKVWIGAESGSQKIIDAMDRRVDVNVVRDMIIAAKKAGISTGTFIMVGYPGEEENDIIETAEHLKKCLPDQFTITLTYPIKGTELYTQIENDLTLIPEWETSSDRDLRFKRAYSDRYYYHAIRYINNAVNLKKAVVNGEIKAPYFALKTSLSRLGMFLNR